jgi:hypothetical protein
MDKASLMHSADRSRERDRDAQEFHYFQWSADQSIERLAAGILEHQRHAIVLPGQPDRPRRPRSIKFGFERILMFELLQATERGVFRGDKQDRRQAIAGAAVEGEASLPQRREYVARKLRHEGLLPVLRFMLDSIAQIKAGWARSARQSIVRRQLCDHKTIAAIIARLDP